MEPEPLIPKHGGYRNLVSFRVAQLCYDVTVRFCERYVPKRSRTNDQMVQAARSGVQNIAEGSEASGTSRKTELKLTNVARASLEELRLDYEDFLRHRNLRLWDPMDPRRAELVARRCRNVEEVARWVAEVRARELENGRNGPDGPDGPDGRNGRPTAGASKSIGSMQSIPSIKSIRPPASSQEIAANAALILIGVATSLLDRQLAALAAAFSESGGFTERLHRVRTQRRKF